MSAEAAFYIKQKTLIIASRGADARKNLISLTPRDWHTWPEGEMRKQMISPRIALHAKERRKYFASYELGERQNGAIRLYLPTAKASITRYRT